MDFITDFLINNICNTMFTIIDKLIIFMNIIFCFMGDSSLFAAEVAQWFFSNIVRLFGLPHIILYDRLPRFTKNI